MHHKRKRPRNRRAGCTLCKPWKVNGVPTEREQGEKFTDHKRRYFATQDMVSSRTLSAVAHKESAEYMWNYRVVRRKQLWQEPRSQEERITYSYGIHEAYYDHGGHVGMITQDAIEPSGETIEELRHAWVMMAEAFGQPFLDYDNIPEPGYDGEYDRGAHDAETACLEDDHEEHDAWKPMTAEERSDNRETQEQERIHKEQCHQQEFIGVHPLKHLINAIYDDYVAWHERNNGEKQDTLSA